MKILQPSVILIFSAIFYWIGALSLAPIGLSLNITVFTVMFAIAFGITVSKLPDDALNTAHDAGRLRGDFERSLVISVGACGAFFLLIYLVGGVGVPILSSNVEVARMVLVNEFGIIYRLGTQLVFFLPPLLILGLTAGKLSRRRFAFLYMVTFVALLSMGFRSRMVDFVMLTAVAFIITEKANHGKFFRLSFSAVLSMTVGASLLIGLVTYLTYLREGGESLGASLAAVYYRAFFLNFEVNFGRIFVFVNHVGEKYGATFVTDVLSFVSDEYNSMQVYVTQYFNRENSDLFIMTPTAYGEFYLNFGKAGWIFVIPIVLLYRSILERAVWYLGKVRGMKVPFFCAAINLIYYFPRQAVTGGVSNSFMVRGVSIILVLIALMAALSILAAVSGSGANGRNSESRY